MSNLKELTWEHHKNAERQGFVKVMMSGRINPRFYATYLWNQHKKYDILEAMAGASGILDDLPDIRRKTKIEQDFLELWDLDNQPVIVESTKKYVEHMKSLIGQPDKLMAHVYTLHMGDLSGGQFIRKKVPGEGRMYTFDTDIPALKDAIRAKTNDDMAEEAKLVFESSTKLFQELMELDGEHYLEQAD
tara:strand:+ start:1185 stop:1751 length:567 start_codon:yes stop_codon:yes gene_type:complete